MDTMVLACPNSPHLGRYLGIRRCGNVGVEKPTPNATLSEYKGTAARFTAVQKDALPEVSRSTAAQVDVKLLTRFF